MTGAEIVKALIDKGAALGDVKAERGVSVARGSRVHEIDVPVKRKSGGTVIERHQIEKPWYTVFSNGNLIAHFNEDDAVDESIFAAVDEALKPLPHEAMHAQAKSSFTAIGLVGMHDSEHAMQLAKVEIADGKVVSVEPLFDCERERDSFAFVRLESTLVGWIANAYDTGDFRGPKKESTDA